MKLKKLCFSNIYGEIITPNDVRYEEARQEWNRAIQKYPIAIVYCESNEDVSEAVDTIMKDIQQTMV